MTFTSEPFQFCGKVALEKESIADKGGFKDKLLNQVGALKTFSPIVKSGVLKGDLSTELKNNS